MIGERNRIERFNSKKCDGRERGRDRKRENGFQEIISPDCGIWQVKISKVVWQAEIFNKNQYCELSQRQNRDTIPSFSGDFLFFCLQAFD